MCLLWSEDTVVRLGQHLKGVQFDTVKPDYQRNRKKLRFDCLQQVNSVLGNVHR